jgi:hypothetical protein
MARWHWFGWSLKTLDGEKEPMAKDGIQDSWVTLTDAPWSDPEKGWQTFGDFNKGAIEFTHRE